jgi:cytochrome c556
MKTRSLAIAVIALGIAGSTFAQMKPEDEIRYRQSVMNVAGRAFTPMIQMAQEKIPYNREVVVKNTQVLETVIGLHWDSFGPGTDKGAPTKADLKIWSEPDNFKASADKAQEAVGKLWQTVRMGDEKDVKAALGGVGKTCKGCHDDYRLKEARN